MSGKHHKSRRRGVQRQQARRLTAVALGVSGLTTAVVAGQTAVTESTPVDLMALITPANSTAQVFASSDYYNRDWSGYGPPQVVPFFLGPQGIADAIDANSTDPRGVVVLASGWGAGQTGTALGDMQSKGDPALNNVRLVVLDNNTNRAGGGFWTTYWMFAPLLATSAAPTPSDLSVPVVDTAYEYNINSDAPTYPINVLADANSLMAYAYDYGGQATAPMPQEALDPVPAGDQHYHYIVDSQGNVVDKIPVDGNITYVTFQSDGLPLVRPLRMVPGGNIIADAVEPAATVLVNAGYQDNKPIPDDPGVQRPVGLLPPASNTETVVNQLPVAVQQGTTKARSDVPSPSPALPNLRTSGQAPRTAITTSSAAPVKKVTGALDSAAKGIAGGLKNLAPHKISTSADKS
ncbi:PE-PPE domain-containing protein [Mycobacterium sp. EPa45]|uniref:PE-PPE domain-containing protein n=1 Tax=Mycobacterium sp. EPa45 TaxID=1545728 RepID=UPI000641C88A|nr:PE-PPE domain-containing protein [Mycobacterium sp. EPa45]AKK26797.1 hypothetical protein AB431_08980 [Mycobacterium sp. EPa45]